MFPNTSPDSTATAQHLAAELERGFADFRDLLQKLQLTPEQLDLLLDEDETRDTLRIRAKLVAHQLKLMALRYAPHAFSKLAQLTESEKPEVARRACNSILRIGGIAPDQLERDQLRKEKKAREKEQTSVLPPHLFDYLKNPGNSVDGLADLILDITKNSRKTPKKAPPPPGTTF